MTVEPGTDLAPLIADPSTGELVNLDGPTDRLAEYLEHVRDIESRLREQKRIVSGEVIRRCDLRAEWTLRFESLKVLTQSPAPGEEFDGLALRSELLGLVDSGVLSIEAVDAAVETVISYKPRAAGIRALRKLGGRVADVVNAHARSVERDRYVKVSRA